MKIAVVCNDTRGGVLPYAALATEFSKAGFEVLALCPAHSSSLFSENNIDIGTKNY